MAITDPPVTFTATASSGLAETFTTTTPTVRAASGSAGSTISLVTAGTCTIQATRPGNVIQSSMPMLSP